MRFFILLLSVTLQISFIVSIRFPNGFNFGASTSSFQIEGGWLQDGKSLSQWDNYAHITGMISDGSIPDVGVNSYNFFMEDIKLMKDNNIFHYRLSISWARIIPKGLKGSDLNQAGINHYRTLLQALLDNGITPYVTIFHNDLPSNLYIHGSGYTDSHFVEHFLYYAQACFNSFGDLVDYWFTFNEPFCLAVYDDYEEDVRNKTPYVIGHNLLLAHGQTVKLFRTMYANKPNKKIGIVLNTEYYYPADPNNPKDVAAAQRSLIFNLNWFGNPIFVNGDYPDLMKQIVGARLPQFTDDQKQMLKGSADFFALNHYFSWLTKDGNNSQDPPSFSTDLDTTLSFDPNWSLTNTGWSIVPQGLQDLLVYVKTQFLQKTLPLFITENGISLNEPTNDIGVNDAQRIDYLQQYLQKAADAITQQNVPLTKYFIWSLLDNFEWGSGFSQKFGIVRVDLDNQAQRIPKNSLKWYSDLILSQKQARDQ